jgi:outer membrane protein OmpA-like peptidoglycan-associated protein
MHNVDVEVFRIVGHTDAVGSPAYNDRLSLLRAQEVKRHLVGDCGIAEERLEAVGVGQRHLLNPDDPAAQENRRVEFQAIS